MYKSRYFTAFIIMEISGLRLRMKRYWRVGRNSLIQGRNWKDFPNVNTYEDYKKVTDKQHLSKAKRMPIRFLKASGRDSLWRRMDMRWR